MLVQFKNMVEKPLQILKILLIATFLCFIGYHSGDAVFSAIIMANLTGADVVIASLMESLLIFIPWAWAFFKIKKLLYAKK
jgi:hypothetical protein